MRKIRASSTLTVLYDGHFWVGIFECTENRRYSVCRIVFGAEPSAEEIQRLVCNDWNRLRFTHHTTLEDVAPKAASNPKRRQREASQQLKQRGPSTKAQRALSQEREVAGQQRKKTLREQREQERRERFEQRKEKRKRKHRGK